MTYHGQESLSLELRVAQLKKKTCGMGDMRLRIRHEDFLRETKFLLVCPDATLLFLLAVTITITNLARV